MEENIPEQNQEIKKNSVGESIKKYFSFAWEIAKIIIIASIIVLPIRYFLFQPFIVKGESMAPNFESGDYLIIDEISYKFNEPQRGDVIVFKYPMDTSQRFIKRIIGLPGETVQVKDGKITVSKDGNNTVLDESYLPESLQTLGEVQITLGLTDYFVLGDNREYSYDSRRWGSVPKEDIIGKVFLRVLPVASLSQITTPNY